MPTCDSTRDLHPQDWALIIEALVELAGAPDRLVSPREERTWELIDIIAAEQGMPASALIRQIDPDWSG